MGRDRRSQRRYAFKSFELQSTEMAEHDMPMTGEIAGSAARPHIRPPASTVAPANHKRDDWLVVGIIMVVILCIMLGGAMLLPLDPGMSQPMDTFNF
jgi:hypothetical protein